MTTVRSALSAGDLRRRSGSGGRRHRMRGAEERLARRRHASRRRHVRPLLREQLLSVAVLVAVLAVTLVLLGLQWLESSPSTAAPTTTIAPITTPGGSP